MDSHYYARLCLVNKKIITYCYSITKKQILRGLSHKMMFITFVSLLKMGKLIDSIVSHNLILNNLINFIVLA